MLLKWPPIASSTTPALVRIPRRLDRRVRSCWFASLSEFSPGAAGLGGDGFDHALRGVSSRNGRAPQAGRCEERVVFIEERSWPGLAASMFMSINAPTPGSLSSPRTSSMTASLPPGSIASRHLLRILMDLSSSQSCRMNFRR